MCFRATIAWLSQTTVAPQEIANETFCLPSKAAPAVRRVVVDYFDRAGIDLKPEHEVHNVVHAISMITSTRAVMLLPAYTKRLSAGIDHHAARCRAKRPRSTWSSRYHKANKSPILKLLLANIGKLASS